MPLSFLLFIHINEKNTRRFIFRRIVNHDFTKIILWIAIVELKLTFVHISKNININVRKIYITIRVQTSHWGQGEMNCRWRTSVNNNIATILIIFIEDNDDVYHDNDIILVSYTLCNKIIYLCPIFCY